MDKEHAIRKRPYWQLAWSMFKTGMLGYGGGPSVIPLIRHEAVERYRWVKDEEFGEIFALANALPGPIATKMAAYLGYSLKKTPGAIVAVLAHIMPSAFLMIALLSAAQLLSGSPIVQGMIAAVGPVIAVMLGLMAYEFAERAVKGLGILFGIVLFAVSFVMLHYAHLHPAIVIFIFLFYGAFHMRASNWLKNRKNRREKKQEGEFSA